MHPFSVVVYGPVGVGKSTVVAALDGATLEKRSVFSVREPTDAMIKSGALQSVGESLTSSGYDLQMLVLAERMSTYWQLQARLRRYGIGRKSIVVADGHLELDQSIFVKEHVRCGRMSTNEYECYSTAVSVTLAQCPEFMQRPQLYIYLHATPKQCLERARARGRSEESQLDAAAMAKFVEACDHLTRTLAEQQTALVVTIKTDGQSRDQVVRLVRTAIAQEVRSLEPSW